jgi:hypothetical protein
MRFARVSLALLFVVTVSRKPIRFATLFSAPSDVAQVPTSSGC